MKKKTNIYVESLYKASRRDDYGLSFSTPFLVLDIGKPRSQYRLKIGKALGEK